MTAIVKFDQAGTLPAYLSNVEAPDLNKDVVSGAAFPSMSIKGKVFTLVKDGVRQILTKPDDPEETAQSIQVVPLRINMNTKVYYDKKFTEGESDGQRPLCYSLDGVVPSDNAMEKQAKKCAICPKAQWGSKITEEGKKGKLCSDNARVAIAAADKLEPLLLRVPPASLKNLRECVKQINLRTLPNGSKLQYNMTIIKISFDPEAASPTLLFKPVGVIADAETYNKVSELYDSETVRGICGVDDVGHIDEDAAPKAADDNMDELDKALAKQKAEGGTVAPAAPAAEPPAPAAPKAPAKAKAKGAEPKPAPKADDAPPAGDSKASALLNELDSLLGDTDD